LIRSFLAIELPKTVLEEIRELQAEMKRSRADVRWVGPEKIHLTLKFFGDIEETKVDEIIGEIEEPVCGTPPFRLNVRGMGAFPHLKSPRIVWIGLVDEKGVLLPLQKELDRNLEKAGFPREKRPFQPHLTLGRVNSSRGKDELIWHVEKHQEDEFGEFEVDKVILFQSDLRPTGPIYTVLREVKLGKP
jgi:RNA 2',3'-cyclic 3'-phosphodiesterase